MTALSVLDGGWEAPLGADAARLSRRRPPRNKGMRTGRSPDARTRRGSIRSAKGGRRREVGMNEWGQELRPWLNARAALPVGPLFCIIDGPTRGRP
jgi:hypothetical protein